MLQALWAEARASGLQASRDAVVQLERRGRDWQVHCRSGNRHSAAWLVVSAGVASGLLLENLGHLLPMEPVLGQALELELAAAPHWNWPGVCQWRGLNLVPRPDLPGRRLWLGATLEPGSQASPGALADLRRWGTRRHPPQPPPSWAGCTRPDWCATGRGALPARGAGQPPCWSSWSLGCWW